jgi:hypothetical protein
MSNFLDIYNEINAELLSDTYEQNVINNIIELTLNQQNAHKQILSEKGEKQLKQVVYNQSTHAMKQCPITLNDFKEGDIVTELPCSHIFDNSGIELWLKTESAKCPVCREALDFVEIKNPDVNTLIMDNSNTIFQTNPLSLFSNITIDLSLNPQLLEPYSREYNISAPEQNAYEALDFEDDIFYNTLQFIEEEDRIIQEAQDILSMDISFNIC